MDLVKRTNLYWSQWKKFPQNSLVEYDYKKSRNQLNSLKLRLKREYNDRNMKKKCWEPPKNVAKYLCIAKHRHIKEIDYI